MRLGFCLLTLPPAESQRTRQGKRQPFSACLASEPQRTRSVRSRSSPAALWTPRSEGNCGRESLAERLRTAYADTDSLPPCLPQTVEFAILQAQYATLSLLQEVTGSGVWSIELPMGRTRSKWYHAVSANELRRYTRDLFHDYVELFTQHRDARVCVVVAPLDTSARQLGGAAGAWRRWRRPQLGRGSGDDAPLLRDSSPETTPSPGLLTYFEDVDPNEELSRCLMRSVFDSARNVLDEGPIEDDRGSLDYIGIAEAAADPETNVLGLISSTADERSTSLLTDRDNRVLVPRDRRTRLQALFAVRNSFLEQMEGIEHQQLFDGHYGDDAFATLPDVVVITNAVASRHLGAVLRVADACERVGVPVLLFNCFLELASLTDVGCSPVRPHEQEALEASHHVRLARERLEDSRLPLPDLLRKIRDGSLMNAEACYVCRALPRLGAVWRMRGAHSVGLGAFPGSRTTVDMPSTAADPEVADPEPWHVFAETAWLEYEYATSVPYASHKSLSATELEHILTDKCGYRRQQQERAFWASSSVDTEALWIKQRETHHAGFWPSMTPAMDFDLWAPPLDAAVDSWMWR